MTRLWGSVFLDAGDTVSVDIDEESERHPYRVRLGTTNVHLDGETVRQLSAAIDAAIITHDAKVWEPYYVDHDAQYGRIGRSHEPPYDVAKAIDAEEVWDSDDRPWHIVSAAAVAKDDVIFDHGKWVTVVNKVPSDSAVLLTFDNDRTAYLPKSTAVRLADKVHPDPCGGGDLPEPGRSFDVV